MQKQKTIGNGDETGIEHDAMLAVVPAAAVVQYLGDGSAYVEGVPARDLTLGEWSRVRSDLRELALELNLYRVPETGAAKAKE